jgi:integrase
VPTLFAVPGSNIFAKSLLCDFRRNSAMPNRTNYPFLRGRARAASLIFTLPDGRGYHPERFSREFERKQSTYNRLHPDTPLPKLWLHDLRHTWASLALKAGVHPKIVQERLGHTDIATTMDPYSHVLPGMQSEAAEQVSNMIFGGGA